MQKAWTHSRTNANCGEVQRCIFFTCKKAFETQISLHKTGWPHHFIFAYSHIMYGKWHIRPPRLDGCKFLPFLSHPSCCLPRNQSVNSLTVRYANNHPIWPFGLVKTDLSHHYDTQLNKKKSCVIQTYESIHNQDQIRSWAAESDMISGPKPF